MTRRPMRIAVAATVLAAWTMLAGGAAAAGNDVTIANFAFAPQKITVVVGETVTWTNNDQPGHTATGDGFDTGTIASGASASVTFTTAGTFAYACRIHPSMTGTVVVEAAAKATPKATRKPVEKAQHQATTPPTDAVAAGSGRETPGPAGPAIAVLSVTGLGVLVLAARRPARRAVRVRRDGAGRPQAKR